MSIQVVKILKNKVFLIIIGLLLILASIGTIWWNYTLLNNPLDQVAQPALTLESQGGEEAASGEGNAEVSLSQLDANENFIPLLEAQSEDLIAAETTEPGTHVWIPDRIVIPAIRLDAPIVPVEYQEIQLNFKTYKQWLVPNEYAAGWHDSSATLGVPGNTVLNGHHNIYGKVFENLVLLQPDDIIQVYSGDTLFRYRVETKMLLPERYEYLSTRMENARWLSASEDERLTLVTCWPADSNTHRVIIVAFPISDQTDTP